MTEKIIVKITRDELPAGHRSTGRSRKTWREKSSKGLDRGKDVEKNRQYAYIQ